MTQYDTVVIGGGISGLGAAYRLQSLRPQDRLCIIEADAGIGGKLISEYHDGFMIEGGPDGFLARKPIVLALSKELGISSEIIEPQPTHRFSHILSEGTLHRMPEGFSGLVPGNIDALRQSDILSSAAIERAAAEKTIPPKTNNEEESVAQFFRRRFGDETFEKLIEPLVSGIFAGDPEQLSIQAAFPQLVAIEKQGSSLLSNIEAARKSPPTRGPTPPAFNSFADGMATLPRAMARVLKDHGADIITNSPVIDLTPSENGTFIVKTKTTHVLARSVIIALSPYDAAGVLGPSFPELTALLSGIPMASVAQLALAFAPETPLRLPEGSGFVVSFRERETAGHRFTAASWSSQKWPFRAPMGGTLVRFYFGGVRDASVWQKDEQYFVDAALTFLAQWNNKAPRVAAQRLFRWSNGMAQLNIGHQKILQELETKAVPGLFLTGAYFKGIGIPDSLERAFECAENVSAFIKTKEMRVT